MVTARDGERERESRRLRWTEERRALGFFITCATTRGREVASSR
jgi:hypothetical protein